MDYISFTFNDSAEPESVYKTIESTIGQHPALTVILKPSRFWKAGCSISLMNQDQRFQSVQFYIGARDSQRANYRLDFNPSKLGADGISQLINFLHAVGMQLDLVPIASVTRIDLALDLPGLVAEQVLVQCLGQQKHGVYTNRLGVPESLYFGSPRSSSRLTAYNKSYRDLGEEYLRIERRMKPRRALNTLLAIANPFARVRIITTDMIPKLNGVIPQFLYDSIRIRGVSRAIKCLPKSQRKLIKDTLRIGTGLIMPPMETIWAQWPQELSQSGLLQFINTDDLGAGKEARHGNR